MTLHWNEEKIIKNYKYLRRNKGYFLGDSTPFKRIVFKDVLDQYKEMLGMIKYDTYFEYPTDLEAIVNYVMPGYGADSKLTFLAKECYDTIFESSTGLFDNELNWPIVEYNDSEILRILSDFFSDLNCPWIYDKFQEFVYSPTTMISLSNPEEDVIKDFCLGKIYFDPFLGYSYVKVLNYKSIKDIMVLVHEIMHGIFTKYQIAPSNLCDNVFEELEGHIGELLFMDYLKRHGKEKEAEALKIDKIYEIYEHSESLIVTDLAVENINYKTGNFNNRALKKKFSKNNITLKTDDLYSVITPDYDSDCYDVISFLVAVDLIEKYKNDNNELFAALSKIKFNGNTSYLKVFQDNKISFPHDNMKNVKQYIKRIQR